MDERRLPTASDPAAALTPRQRQILAFIGRTLRERGLPPTRAEIAATFGFRSPNAAQAHLVALARKGVLELLPGSARGIRLRAALPESVGATDAAAPAHGGAVPTSVTPAHGAAAAAPVLGQRHGSATPAVSNAPAIPLRPPLTRREAFEADWLQLPLIGRVAAGSPVLAQAHVEAVYPADARWFARRPDYLLRVRGWSMRDAGIWDGDIVAVQAVREARAGQVVVARLGDEVTVKRLQREGRGWRLQAANPDVADIVVRPGQELVIEGVVVGLLRPQGWL
ncbi:transcriptional repressor LexA [Tepidimonas charontis]|uniref:LexA repressor n=1 Tax=Tepidimonas charontis TaxID=2267262 RepID=A0A554X380_9BURK|nr:transcriptional repressor LexA [Tepidimonas charontis]TSE30299.1 LexA repressor [Tepidimonas charontis]